MGVPHVLETMRQFFLVQVSGLLPIEHRLLFVLLLSVLISVLQGRVGARGDFQSLQSQRQSPAHERRSQDILLLFLLDQVVLDFNFLEGPMANQVPFSFHLHVIFLWPWEDGQLDHSDQKL